MHYAKNHHQSLGLKFCFRLQMFRKLLSSLLISGSLWMNSTKAPCFVPNCNNKTFWLHYRPGLCPCWLLAEAHGYSSITVQSLLNRKLYCLSSTFVVLSSLWCWQNFLDSVWAIGGWQSFVLIGLQCVYTFAFTVPLFCCCTHPNYLIYSKRDIMWLWTI